MDHVMCYGPEDPEDGELDGHDSGDHGSDSTACEQENCGTDHGDLSND